MESGAFNQSLSDEVPVRRTSSSPGRMAEMRYRLRTLLMVLALGPVALAFGWYAVTGGRYTLEIVVFGILAALWTAIASWPRFQGKGG